jgi:hypothetical protein
MGRKRKKSIDGFIHSVYHDDDPRVIRVTMKYGSDGYSLYLCLKNFIFKSDYYAKLTEDDCLRITRYLSINLEQFHDVLSEYLEVGLFHEELYKRHGILTSEDLQSDYLQVVKKRKSAFIPREYWLLGST